MPNNEIVYVTEAEAETLIAEFDAIKNDLRKLQKQYDLKSLEGLYVYKGLPFGLDEADL